MIIEMKDGSFATELASHIARQQCKGQYKTKFLLRQLSVASTRGMNKKRGIVSGLFGLL